jgi:hypothetical protein
VDGAKVGDNDREDVGAPDGDDVGSDDGIEGGKLEGAGEIVGLALGCGDM